MPSAQPQRGLKLFRRKASKLEQQSCFPEAEGQQGLTLGLEPWRVERGGRLERSWKLSFLPRVPLLGPASPLEQPCFPTIIAIQESP